MGKKYRIAAPDTVSPNVPVRAETIRQSSQNQFSPASGESRYPDAGAYALDVIFTACADCLQG